MPTPPFDTPPNAAFVDSPKVVSDKRLDSPSIPIETSSAQLTFRKNYYTETRFDGGVLEISIDGGAFQDIIAAAAVSSPARYSGTLSQIRRQSAGWSPGLDRQLDSGFITTIVNLPPSAAGQKSCCAGAWAATPASGLRAGASTRSGSASASIHRRRRPTAPPPPPLRHLHLLHPHLPATSTPAADMPNGIDAGGDRGLLLDPSTTDVPAGTTVCWTNTGQRGTRSRRTQASRLGGLDPGEIYTHTSTRRQLPVSLRPHRS